MSRKRKVAVVTGGATGIGLGIAESLADAGYDLALLDVNRKAAETAAAGLGHGSVRAIGVQCDVATKPGVEAAASVVVKKLGEPYLLVNNAGISRIGSLEDVDLADWRAVIDVNLTGVFICTQVFGSLMLAAGTGCIVNVASVSGSHPQTLRPGYSPSKAGVIALTQVTALEWGHRGVRCNAISPGMVWTTISGPLYAMPEILEERKRQIPAKRLADAAEMSSVVVFLASDAASYINGVNIPVDAGLGLSTLNRMPTMGPGGKIIRPELEWKVSDAPAGVRSKTSRSGRSGRGRRG